MKTNRRKFSAEQKAKVLRKHLVEKVPISQICDEYGNLRLFVGKEA